MPPLNGAPADASGSVKPEPSLENVRFTRRFVMYTHSGY
jgi:hypothetical protein